MKDVTGGKLHFHSNVPTDRFGGMGVELYPHNEPLPTTSDDRVRFRIHCMQYTELMASCTHAHMTRTSSYVRTYAMCGALASLSSQMARRTAAATTHVFCFMTITCILFYDNVTVDQWFISVINGGLKASPHPSWPGPRSPSDTSTATGISLFFL